MGTRSFRPTVTGNVHAVSSGQYLATTAGFRILEQGGNAIDAGVAAGIALNVVLPASTSFGGVAPILIYSATDKKVHSISGLGSVASGGKRQLLHRTARREDGARRRAMRRNRRPPTHG